MKKKVFDLLIVTNIPNYYKINLFNAIAKECRLLVLFITGGRATRAKDFSQLPADIKFKYHVLNESAESRNIFLSCVKLFITINKYSIGKLVVGEWKDIEYWFSLFFFTKQNTFMLLESNIHSGDNGFLKSLFKKIFLSQISQVFASGSKHAELLNFLNYKGKITISKGVGIINYQEPIAINRTNHFLYVGRLSQEKNLELLITVFNKLPYQLTIIGEGPQEAKLKGMANDNVSFLGYVKNKNLGKYFSSHRALILISANEPYGLVAEESIYFGTPVIVSSVCGVVDTICIDKKNSMVVDGFSVDDINRAVKRIMDPVFYEGLVANCGPEVILNKDKSQVGLYLQHLT